MANVTAWARNHSKLITAGVVALLVLAFGVAGLVWQRNLRCDLKLTEVCVSLERVDTPESRAKGLSGRDSLGQDQGMLFVYDEDGSNCIWMPNMRFSIDIVWLSADKKIVKTEEAVSPSTYPEHFCSTDPSRYVIELPSGSVLRYELQIGQKLSF